MGELRSLEEDGWAALSAGGDAAVDFYGRVLDDDVTMLLPGGLTITDRAEAIRSMSGTPWDRHELADVIEAALTPDTGLVTYAATATRAGGAYSASIASLYVRRPGGWRLRFHQQTPR